MTAPKREVGQDVEVPERTEVERPDGSRVTVSGGLYVFDVPGAHVIDGKKHEVV
ncbi:hypothetical protein KDN32_17755 [Nocardioides sp. J2M5]|uniref:hypothetical protein n=1 Tax=Nocardioides palaemonis TaxID=2829810 RepID=UPI001BAAA743|nr:hypothetical protein [Nocardioides palaemonis]MBS2939588.1 hypothetical protein [Nocardioides palaemonis]